MQIVIHQTHHQVADFDSIYNEMEKVITDNDDKLHLFPELFLTGYPLADLCLQATFIQKYHLLIDKINTLLTSKESSQTTLLVGALHYELDKNTLPNKISNVIYELKPGQEIKNIYSKMLLPNYDIFDEKKYFHPGSEVCVYQYKGKQLALQICEDMWPSTGHDINPTKELKSLGQELDLLINLSASPFNLDKQSSRYNRAAEISNSLKCPFVYVNRVGGEDEILFDGASFVCNANKVIHQAIYFNEQTLEFTLPEKVVYTPQEETVKNSWEDLFSPSLNGTNLKAMNHSELDLLEQSLCFGLQEYATKCGFNKFSIALSGGLDSALVLALTKLSLKNEQSVEAIYMPSEFSSELSYDLSKQMCNKLDIPFYQLPIKELHNATRKSFKNIFSQELEGLSDENIQSRLRGTLLYARSNHTNSMVINTSNKSEIAVGYSTIYGDSVGAISLLGDVYKSEVFLLAKHLNQKYKSIIPEDIINRPPTAELRENQKDTDSLPAYEILDAILEGLLSYRLSPKDLIERGFKESEVELTTRLYKNSEYKRAQFPPIIKVKSKSFGFGYRVPISKNKDLY